MITMDKQFRTTLCENAALKIFTMLKRFCDPIALTPTIQNINELKLVLENLPPENLQLFRTYVLLPFYTHLYNQNHTSTTVCALLECLHIILSKTKVVELNTFLKIFMAIFKQIVGNSEPNIIIPTSEELKLNVVQCAIALLKNTEQHVLYEFYSRQHYGKLSVVVYACTRIAVNEKSIQLREKTLEALISLTQVRTKMCVTSEYRQQVADVVMLMLPGIVSHSLAVATATDIQNHKIIVLAIKLWSRVVGLVMEDILENNDKNKNIITFSIGQKSTSDSYKPIDWSANESKTKEMINQTTRSHSWIKNSNKQLAGVTREFAKLHGHRHWKVRLELVLAADHILCCAARNMCLSVPYLIEVLIILSQDEQNEVRSSSMKAIKSFSVKCEINSDVKSLVQIVKESLYELITKLPRIFHGVDLTLKERQLFLVSGYLDVLGNTHVPSLLHSVQHLHRLMNSIFIAAALDCSSITLLEEVSLRGIDINYASSNEDGWRKFKWCTTQKSQNKIEEICRKLIKYSELSWFIHFLLDKFSSEIVYRKEITLIFHYIFMSDTAKSSNECDLAINVFKSLMDQNLWSLPVSVNIDDGITKAEAQSNVIQICSITETVASLGHYIGKELFLPQLLRCLYPLLECAGSPLYMIATAGLKSVNRIAQLYGSGISDLISNNVDYLSHHVTLNLRHAHRNPRVVAVLSVIMKHSTFNALPSIHEIVNDVLLQSCDNFQEGNASTFLQAFFIFIMCLKEWCPDEFTNLDENKNKSNQSIVGELLDYQKTKLEAEQLEDDDDEIEDTETNKEEMSVNLDVDKVKNKTVPNHIKLTVQILTRSLHFLPSKDQSKQILVIQILENGVIILRKWKEELLPTIHKIWAPLTQRFIHCDNHLVMQRAFSLLKVLGKVSRDFIRIRTLKEVLPSLCDTLKRTAKSSLKCEKEAYKLSQKYKLQLCVLQGLAELSIDLELQENELDKILEVITPYLNTLQPQTLQDACVNTFLLLSKNFPDLIWIHLMSICPKKLYFQPPNSTFPTYQFHENSIEMKEYKKNVHKLLDSL